MTRLLVLIPCLLVLGSIAFLLPFSSSSTAGKGVDCAGQGLASCAKNACAQRNWSGVITCAYDFLSQCQESAQTHEVLPSQYDITINGKWTFLRNLGSEGWRVNIADHITNECKKEAIESNEMEMEMDLDFEDESAAASVPEPTDSCSDSDSDSVSDLPTPATATATASGANGVNAQTFATYSHCLSDALLSRGCFVAWIGGFNKGKTTLMNRVTGKDFPTGYDADGETRGLNFLFGEHKIIHIDTPGATRCVPYEQLQDRYMTDRFVYDLIPDIAGVIILVVDILTADEQVIIQQLMEKISLFATAENTKELYIIHNFKTLSRVMDVEHHIETDIVMAFGGTREQHIFHGEYYVSQFVNSGLQATHFIYAAEHSEAAAKWNTDTKNLLISWINGMRCKAKDVKLLEFMIQKLTSLLREYFRSQPEHEVDLTDPTGDEDGWGWGVLGRVRKWIKSNVFRMDEPNPALSGLLGNVSKSDPYQLMFEPSTSIFSKSKRGKTTGDGNNMDGRLILRNQHDLEYCNVEKIGDTPVCRPEPNCAVWETEEQWTIQCGMPAAVISDEKIHMRRNPVTKDHVRQKLVVYLNPKKREVVLCGTLLPMWSNKIPVEEKASFKLLHSDGISYGWVYKAFQISFEASGCWSHRNVTHEDGVLTVAVPIDC